ncbi:AAA family ATPase [Gimesia maris]|uniref:Chaperone BssE n=1 Tax=Gimesia maris TaxID=122 RepID=A0ABX5YRM7_9PLAN|nr:AAA family ATPase [Gimesia maris]EDL59244.1 ATPase associated with various cellular activities, AAA_5 [Gimesia maris DSM 8797]QEG18218.1 Putative chaperone BssE [Gimesia maris]QGQ28781.1 AAA domain-containing protein [Gimesia maris]
METEFGGAACTNLEESAISERRDVVRDELRESSKELNRLDGKVSELLTEVQDGRYWAGWGFKSFEEFVHGECSFGLRKAQELIRVRKIFVGELGLSSEQLESIKWSKAAIVARVINEENRDKMLDALSTESLRELRERVRRMIAIQSHLEDSLVDNEPIISSAAKKNELIAESSSDSTDWRLPRPDESEFYVLPEIWEQICHTASRGKSVLLVGPSGCGKSEIVYRFAEAAGRQLDPFNFGAMSEPRSTLIGNTHLDREKGTIFQKSRFVSAIETPNACVLLDEISRAGREAFNILLPLLDRQGYLALDESEDSAIIHRAENVCFFATANIGMEYTGASELDQALTNRFSVVIHLEFPPFEQELSILLSRCSGLVTEDAEQLLQIAHLQRQQAQEGDFLTTISTRSLIEAGHQVAGGIRLSRAFRYCILNRFPEDGGDVGERARLQQLFARFVDESDDSSICDFPFIDMPGI